MRRLLLAFLLPVCYAAAQNPHRTEPDLTEGARLFAANCPACHGADARGGRGSNLVSGTWKHGSSAAEIARNIHEGIGGTAMPAFPLPGEQTRAIADWLLSLNPGPGEGEHPKASKSVEVTTRSGEVIQGFVVGEDTFSLYLRDQNEKLHLLSKQELRSRRDLTTPMPAPVPQPAADFNVTWARLKNSADEPQNWLHYWGDLQGTHYSALKSVTPANVGRLAAQWTFQFGGSGVETTPIVADGLMFVTGPRDNAAALDARTGFPIWRYRRPLPEFHANCTVTTNRGFAILGDRLYLGTLDSHLVALNAQTGAVVFDVAVDDYKKGFSITHAPLVVDGKIIVGVTAGECALYGFINAYDATTGKRLWRVHSVAQPGDPARARTWAGKSAETGGSPTWMTGTYDPETDTLYWTTGNPSPDYDGSVRAGDNLYTCSVLALDPATGRMKWYFQFTPHDTHDWDATETPVLVDSVFQGKPRKLMIHADRNAFYYVLDRETGEFLLGKAFAKQTWATGLDAKGRPMVIPNTDPTPAGVYVCPDAQGATNWNSPSYDPLSKLFFVGGREACSTYKSIVKEPKPGLPFTGTGDQTDSDGVKGNITAIDPMTGEVRWKFALEYGSASTGLLATGGGVLFGASKDGYIVALEARTGKLLWRYQTGAEIRSSPIAYALNGREYIAISNDSSLMVFALPQ